MQNKSKAVLDRNELHAALDDADPVILLMVLVQLTGDVTLLDRMRPFIRKARDQQPGDLPAELQLEIKTRLLDALSSGAIASPLPGDDAVASMIATCVGETVPPNYVSMLLHVADLAAAKPAPAMKVPTGFRVVMIGAGLSAIALAVYLKKAGIDFLMLERSAEPGGVWVDNNYPGCGVDTASHFYSYSFAQNPDWSRYFASKDEIKRYIADCVDRFGLREHLRLNAAVRSTVYDDTHKRWTVTLESNETIECAAVVSAVGQLNEPAFPHINGLETFRGPVVHTARWPADLDCTGKRVALIGTGASSVQVGPAIAPLVQRLVVFQRSPQWLRSKPGYHDAVSEAHRWVFRNVPHYGNWFRLRLAWQYGDLGWPASRIDAERGEGVRISKANDALRAQWTEYMHAQLKDRPDLLPKVIPDYPPMTKRTPVDNGWLEMLKRTNVDLVAEAIDHVGPDFIQTKDGAVHGLDVIVLATGFQASRMLQSIHVTGRGGRDIRDLWGEEDPHAYLGITVPGFPNFFVMYGPNTNLGGAGNIIFNAECQANYIVAALRHLFAAGRATIEVTQDASDRFNQRLDERLSGSVFSTPGVNSSFKNSKGRVRSVSPWRIEEYWRMTRDLDENDYHLD
jgi:4-hydroxyacetophenone monooxygenase